MRGGSAFWTEERTERLKTLLAEGHSASAMAVILGHPSRSAVIGKVHRLGLSFAHSSPKRKRTKARVIRRAAPQPLKISPPRRALEMAPEPMPFVIVEEVVVPEKERVGVEGLGPHQCKWPIGDPQSPDFHFCHHKRIGGISYCETHAKRAFAQPPTASNRPFVLYKPGVRTTVKEDA
jgi:GcrA cell cycle regulator